MTQVCDKNNASPRFLSFAIPLASDRGQKHCFTSLHISQENLNVKAKHIFWLLSQKKKELTTGIKPATTDRSRRCSTEQFMKRLPRICASWRNRSTHPLSKIPSRRERIPSKILATKQMMARIYKSKLLNRAKNWWDIAIFPNRKLHTGFWSVKHSACRDNNVLAHCYWIGTQRRITRTF